MPTKKKRHPAPKNGERKNGELPGFNVGKNATIREILAEARTFMTPQEYRDFSRKPKDDGGIFKIPKGATMKEIYALCRKKFTAWDLQKYTRDEPMVPVEDDFAAMEEIHRLTVEALNENITKARRQQIYAALSKHLGYDVKKLESIIKRTRKTREKAS